MTDSEIKQLLAEYRSIMLTPDLITLEQRDAIHEYRKRQLKLFIRTGIRSTVRVLAWVIAAAIAFASFIYSTSI